MRPADNLLDRARPDALVEAGQRVLGGGERRFQGIQQAPLRNSAPRTGRGIGGAHASSAATLISIPLTRAGASMPLDQRSRET